MKRTQITITLTLPGEDRPTVGDAQDIFDALDEVARRMGADVRIEPARDLVVCNACAATVSRADATGWAINEDDRDLCAECCSGGAYFDGQRVAYEDGPTSVVITDEELVDASPAEIIEIYKRMRSRSGGRWESRYNLATCSTTWTWRPDRTEHRDGVAIFEATRCDECNAVSEVEVESGVLEATPGPDLCSTCAAKPRGATDG